MNENGATNGSFAASRIIELTHGKLLIKPYSMSALALVKSAALKRAGLEEPKPPVRMVKSETLPPRPLEYFSLAELEGLEEDEEYQDLIEALMAYNDELAECDRVQGEAAQRLIYSHSLWPCDDAGETLSKEYMTAALEEIGLEAPEETYELKRLYINCFLVGNEDTETDQIGKIVTLMSWPQEDEVQAHLESFLDNYRWSTTGRIRRRILQASGEDGDTLSDDASGERRRGDGLASDGQANVTGESAPVGMVESEEQD